MSISTLASKGPRVQQSTFATLELQRNDGKFAKFVVNILPTITDDITRERLSASDVQFLSRYKTQQFTDTLPKTQQAFVPDILIGIDYFFSVLGNERRTQLPSGLWLVPQFLDC